MTRTPGRPLAVTLAAVALSAALGGCGSGAPDSAFGAQPKASPTIELLPVPSASPMARGPAGPLASYREVGGVVLPDARHTPGAAFPDVTREAVCATGYDDSVQRTRFADKVEAFGFYGISMREREQYQVDLLIPVSLGGTTAATNLWPQPYGGRGANQKDELEAHLGRLVCTGRLELRAAQQAIAEDWGAAAATYLAVPLPAVKPTGRPPTSPAPVVQDAVRAGGPCPTAGEVGRSPSKQTSYTCLLTNDGTLKWSRRS